MPADLVANWPLAPRACPLWPLQPHLLTPGDPASWPGTTEARRPPGLRPTRNHGLLRSLSGLRPNLHGWSFVITSEIIQCFCLPFGLSAQLAWI
jgi:hypothetical protein